MGDVIESIMSAPVTLQDEEVEVIDKLAEHLTSVETGVFINLERELAHIVGIVLMRGLSALEGDLYDHDREV